MNEMFKMRCFNILKKISAHFEFLQRQHVSKKLGPGEQKVGKVSGAKMKRLQKHFQLIRLTGNRLVTLV